MSKEPRDMCSFWCILAPSCEYDAGCQSLRWRGMHWIVLKLNPIKIDMVLLLWNTQQTQWEYMTNNMKNMCFISIHEYWIILWHIVTRWYSFSGCPNCLVGLMCNRYIYECLWHIDIDTFVPWTNRFSWCNVIRASGSGDGQVGNYKLLNDFPSSIIMTLLTYDSWYHAEELYG